MAFEVCKQIFGPKMSLGSSIGSAVGGDDGQKKSKTPLDGSE